MRPRVRFAAHQVNSLQAKAIAAAMHVLEEQGADSANIRAIADQAGVGVASIYHYFRTKDELLLKLAAIGLDELLDDISRRCANPQGLSPTRAAATAFFAFVETRPALFSLMFDSRMLSRHAALREAEQRIFHAYLEAMRADDRIVPEHQEEATFAIWALGRGMAAMMSSYGGVLPPEKAQTLRAGARFLIDRAQ